VLPDGAPELQELAAFGLSPSFLAAAPGTPRPRSSLEWHAQSIAVRRARANFIVMNPPTSPVGTRFTIFVAEDVAHRSAKLSAALRNVSDHELQLYDSALVMRLIETATGGATSRVGTPRGGLAPGVRRRVVQYIERRLALPLPTSDLAAIAGLSEFHFARAFKQSFGMPPHRFLIERRLEAAAEFIRSTDHRMSQIAIDVGFFDQSHFTRLFVRKTGETPRSYRRRHR
jgi:AraC-like DNA-binding protein